MAQAKKMLSRLKRYQEGGEVEMPEEQASPVTEAAKQMLFYNKTAAPRLPPGVVPDTGQADGIYQDPTVASETGRVFGMQPREDRLSILPRYSRETGLVAPEMLYDAARAVTAPSVAARGYEVAPEDAVNMAVNFMGAGVGTSAAMKKPTGEGGKVVASSILPSSTTAREDLAKMPKASKVLAPANESGFYSPTEAAALNLQRKSGAGQAFLNDIMKGENVRADEIKTMGLDTFLKDKKNVTADEVRDYIAQNKTQLGESVYDSKGKPNFLEFLKQKGFPEDEALSILNKAEDGVIDNQVAPLRDEYLNLESKSTKFKDYSLPGGENYREIVLTLPEKSSAYTLPLGASVEKTPSGKFRVTYKDGSSSLFMDERKLSQAFGGENLTYQSSHWDEPNALAHLRVSDRVTDGKKTLLIDEVQSDWHQAGREKGYKSDFKPIDWNDPEYVQARKDSVNATNAFNSASGNPALQATLRAEMERAREVEVGFANISNKKNQAIPDAPYKDDWYQLTLRRAIKEAIDGGYDRVALPTGDRVAERFDLSKQIESISHQKNPDGTYKIVAVDKNNRHAMNEESVSEDKLSSIVGKDIAQKIINAEGKPFPEGSVGEGMTKLSGLDLKVGGEGMRKYYDEIYPGYLKKFGKKYGSQSGKTTVDVEGKPEPLFYMEITPKMREEFTSGIPMKDGGEVRRYI